MNGLWNTYPYTDFHEMNLDWILKRIREMETSISNFINLNTIKYADPIAWNITSQYESNTVVIDNQTGNAYISTHAVPSGVAISNTDYWTQIFNYASELDTLREQIAAANEKQSTTATAPRAINDLVWVKGDLLKITAPMIAGDSYVIGSNCVKTTIEECIIDNSALDTEIADRIAADNLLQANIDAEELARITADNAITDKIKNLHKYNVKEYGAKGDDSTDDTQAFSDAISDINLNGSGCLYIPVGKYKLKSSFTFNSLATIKGEGRGSSQLLFDSSVSSDDCFTFNAFELCDVQDVTIYTTTTGYAISCSTHHAMISNNNIHCINGINFRSTAGRVMNNTIICPNGKGINVVGSDSSCMIFGNDIGSSDASRSDTGSGINIEAGNSSCMMIMNSIILKNVGIQINTDATHPCFSERIAYNFIDNSVTAAISLSGSGTCYRSMITNNWIGGGVGFGILCSGSAVFNGLTISENEFFVIATAAINCPNSTGLRIFNNVGGNIQTFINISNNEKLYISSNILGLYGGESSVTTGLSFLSEPSDYTIENNDFSGCTNKVYGTWTVGDNHIIRYNKGYITEAIGYVQIPAGQTSATAIISLPIAPNYLQFSASGNTPDSVSCTATSASSITFTRSGTAGNLTIFYSIGYQANHK